MENQYIKREYYLKKLRGLRDQHLIKVLTGVRRCGKSVLLEMFRDELLAEGVPAERVVALNFEEPESVGYRTGDWRAVYQQILDGLVPGEMNYVFLDEVQNVAEFERMVDGLYAKKNVDLYITGSNAYFLSSELATVLSGRYVEIGVFPFSFEEYGRCRRARVGEGVTEEALFQEYLTYGAFPQVAELLNAGREEFVNDYLTGVVNTVLVKDVVRRQGAGNSKTAERIMRFMLGNVGSVTSPNNIAGVMTADHQAVSRPTVASYLTALTESFLLYEVERFDVRGKKLLQSLAKYYTVDLGLRRAMLGSGSGVDVGHLVENVVCLELMRRYAQVWVGQAETKEVDFVVRDGAGDTAYYQVAYTVRDEATLARELAPLLAVGDNHPKFLLTMDAEERNFEGVRQVNLVGWLGEG